MISVDSMLLAKQRQARSDPKTYPPASMILKELGIAEQLAIGCSQLHKCSSMHIGKVLSLCCLILLVLRVEDILKALLLLKRCSLSAIQLTGALEPTREKCSQWSWKLLNLLQTARGDRTARSGWKDQE